MGHHGYQRLSQSPRWFTPVLQHGRVRNHGGSCYLFPEEHSSCSQWLLLLCFSLPALCHKTKTQTHYESSTITPAEPQRARIKRLLCHSNVHEITDWEGIQLSWTQQKSYSLWSIGISGLRSITPSTASGNNISIAVIKCTHSNREARGESSRRAKFYDSIYSWSRDKEKCNFQ